MQQARGEQQLRHSSPGMRSVRSSWPGRPDGAHCQLKCVEENGRAPGNPAPSWGGPGRVELPPVPPSLRLRLFASQRLGSGEEALALLDPSAGGGLQAGQ